MVDWDQWQTVLAIFRDGTYSRAAKSLRVDATTIGRRLKLLEKHIGYTLFFRQNGSLHPTRQCETLLSHVEAASESLRHAERRSADSERAAIWHNLRLAAPPFMIKNLFAPGVSVLTQSHRIRIELPSSSSNASLSRREADIAIHIDDHPQNPRVETDQVDSEKIGELTYAVYCAQDIVPESLPWAGLLEDHGPSSGSDVMNELAGPEGFQYRAYLFDSLIEIVASGAAQAILPRFIADYDVRLQCTGDTLLAQDLRMLSHKQDRGIQHIEATKQWVRECTATHFENS